MTRLFGPSANIYISVRMCTVDGGPAPWLWHVVPGFVGTTGLGPLTICRVTHPTFLSSMRLFGVPTDHPSRLERHAPLLASSPSTQQPLPPRWVISIHSKSHLGVVQYQIRQRPAAAADDDASKDVYLQADALAEGVSLGPLPADQAISRSTTWYILPLLPDEGSVGGPRGWEIVHAGSGRRLVEGADGASLRLTGSLETRTVWDVLVFSPYRREAQRTHFWLPEFLADTLGQRHAPYFAGQSRMRPVQSKNPVPVSTATTTTAGPERRTVARADCLKQCAEDDTCNAAAVDNEGGCRLFRGYTVPSEAAFPTAVDELWGGPVLPTLNGLVWKDVLERRLLRDARVRGAVAQDASTREFGLEGTVTNTTLYAKVPAESVAEPITAYRECLRRFGLDAVRCQKVLAEATGSSAERAAEVQRQVLGDWDNKPVKGLCAGADLRSGLCQDFCSTAASRTNRSCERRLWEHCAGQTQGGMQEGLCGCWLADDTYKAIWRSAFANSGIEQGSALAARINEVLQRDRIPPSCWYAGCWHSALRPPEGCPSTINQNCILVSENNQFSSGGGQQHEQACNLTANGGPSTTGTGDDTPTGGEEEEDGSSPPPADPVSPADPPPPPPPAPDNNNGPAAAAATAGAVVVSVAAVSAIGYALLSSGGAVATAASAGAGSALASGAAAGVSAV